MAGDIPTVQSLDRPERFQDVMKRDRQEDCLGCKIVGTGSLLGLGAYSYYSGMSQLEKQRAAILKSKSIFGLKSRKFGIASISLGLAYMGLWRAFN